MMIDDYRFGRIQVGGRTCTSDVIVYPDHVADGWRRQTGHGLCMDDLRDVVAAKPEVLIVGTGAYGAVKVPDDVREQLSALGIELRVAETAAACKMYNELAPQTHGIAALHLTC